MDKFLAQHLDFVGLILCIGVTFRYFVVTSSRNLKICTRSHLLNTSGLIYPHSTRYMVSLLDLLWFRFSEVVNFNLASLSSSAENDNFQIVNLLPNDVPFLISVVRCA